MRCFPYLILRSAEISTNRLHRFLLPCHTPEETFAKFNEFSKISNYVKDAVSESERRKFLDLVQYFKDYSDKYMRFMVDRYYANEPMTELDKALFTFASYNAGPAGVARLRKEAAQRGLDPNVWLHNVEHVAADRIGAETVTYVSNIYKYYIAYKLVMEARESREKAAETVKSQSK